MTRRPWFKFYPSDWRGDAKLRMCSFAARGLWIDLMCIMHEADPYGYLMVNGHQPSDKELAAMVGTHPKTFKKLLGELEGFGVCSRDKTGAIYSRRMVKDKRLSDTGKETGRKGGNPQLTAKKDNGTDNEPLSQAVKGQDNASIPKTLNGCDNGGVKGSRAREPEARGQSHNSPPPVTGAAGAGAADADADGSGGGSTGQACKRIQRIVNAGHPLPDLARYVERWREHGLDLERDVLPTIEQVMERRNRRNEGPPTHPKYFDAACFRAHERRTEPPPDTGEQRANSGSREGITVDGWRQLVRLYQRTGTWYGPGPEPGENGCKAPSEVIAEFHANPQRKRAAG